MVLGHGAVSCGQSPYLVDFRGFYSSIILDLRGGLLMSIGDFPESLSQAMLVGIVSVGRLGVGHGTVSYIAAGSLDKDCGLVS